MTEQEIRDLWRELALSVGNGRIEVSSKQLGLMNGLLADALKPLVGNPGLRDARLRFLRRVTELPIESSKQLPFAWVTTIIDQLIEKDDRGESAYPYQLSGQGASEVGTIWREIMRERGQLEMGL